MATAAAPRSTPGPWLHGPWSDLLLGCGLGYAVVFGIQLFAWNALVWAVPLTLAPILSVLFGTPHYGATLLRVYARWRDVRHYFVFSVIATGLLAAGFVQGLWDPRVAALLVTLYATWSPWHYTGQNYGVALLFLGRRGVAVDATTKRLLHLGFMASYVLVFLTLHGARAGATYQPVQANAPLTLLQLGIPARIAGPAFDATLLAYAGLLVAAIGRLLRRGSLAALAPALLLLATQAIWFAIPVTVQQLGGLPGFAPYSPENGGYTMFWVAAAHAAQYLWVTRYYAARSHGAAGGLRVGGYYAVALAAGAALWSGLPALVAHGGLGPTIDAAALTALVAATVNLHHFVLDGAIWKLRDRRIASVLLRRVAETSPVEGSSSWHRAARVLQGGVLAFGLVAALATALQLVLGEYAVRRPLRAGELVQAERGTRWLGALGRDGADLHDEIARVALERRLLPLAEKELRVAVERGPTANTWRGLGRVAEERGDWRDAALDYERAVALDPKSVFALARGGYAWRRAGEPARGQELLERAAALDPGDRILMRLVELGRSAGSGGVEDAAAASESSAQPARLDRQ